MATSKVDVTEGSGKSMATYSFTEDAVTKQMQRVSAPPETSAVSNAGTYLTPKFALISCSSSGNNTILAGVTSKKLRVLEWNVSPSAAVNVKWRSSTAGDLTGLVYMAGAGNGIARTFNPSGYFETTAGEDLQLNLSGAVPVGGSLVYIEV